MGSNGLSKSGFFCPKIPDPGGDRERFAGRYDQTTPPDQWDLLAGKMLDELLADEPEHDGALAVKQEMEKGR